MNKTELTLTSKLSLLSVSLFEDGQARPKTYDNDLLQLLYQLKISKWEPQW